MLCSCSLLNHVLHNKLNSEFEMLVQTVKRYAPVLEGFGVKKNTEWRNWQSCTVDFDELTVIPADRIPTTAQ